MTDLTDTRNYISVKAPQMQTGRIVTIALCKFTGERYEGEECPARAKTHADVDCFELFHSASALLEGDVLVTPIPSREVRMQAEPLATEL